MQRLRPSSGLIVRAAALFAALACAAPACAQALERAVRDAISDAPFTDEIEFSVCVMDVETGEILAAHDEDRRLIPASNMKLLTSGAALHVLGPRFEFVTELVLFRDAGPAGADRLVVRGSGDPAFADFELLEDMGVTVEGFIALWIDAIEASGVADSVGEIVVDDRVFDREYVHRAWPEAQLNRWYCAQVAGVNFHANVLRLFTKPAGVGQRPVVAVEPETPWIRVDNNAKTVGRGKRHTAWASRVIGSNSIGLHADVRHASTPIEVTVHEPSMVLGRVLATRLAPRGHDEPEVRLADERENLSGGETIHRVRTPLAVVLERCNTDSHNLYAEALLKRTGAEATGAAGSWERGGFALRSLLVERLGADVSGEVVVSDGSGMSRENRLTTEVIVRWLRSMERDRRLRSAFRASLPSAGEEGTLRKRFRRDRPENEVLAKTGYLSGVTALSGYVTDARTGRVVAFSILTNEKPSDVSLRAVRNLEERLVLLIDEHVSAMSGAGALGG